MSMQYIGTGRLGATQSVAYTATAGTIANGIGSGAYKVRVICTTDAFIKIGAAPTATTSDTFMPANSVEYFTIYPGEKVSAVQSAAAGTLRITGLS